MAKIHFLNVDEGDCSIIQHDNGHVTMIDICCGNIEKQQKTAEQIIKEAAEGLRGNFNQKAHPTNPVDYLKNLNINQIFRYIQTHPDMDHMDGLNNLFNNFSILNFWDTENSKTQDFDENGKSGRYLKIDWDCYQSVRKRTDNPKTLFYYDGDVRKYFAYNDSGTLQDDYLKILAPTHKLLKDAEKVKNWNDSSYVILYYIHNRRILFCGDADEKTIAHLMQNHKSEISNIDILIAPHHGRDSDKDFSFLDIMKPKLTLFGNAKSKYLAYDEWNNRDLIHIQNNQAGNILINILGDGKCQVSCIHQTFANEFNKIHYHNETAPIDKDNKGYWRLI